VKATSADENYIKNSTITVAKKSDGANGESTWTISFTPVVDDYDPATMTVIGPETNAAGAPFSLDVLWHDIDTETVCEMHASYRLFLMRFFS